MISMKNYRMLKRISLILNSSTTLSQQINFVVKLEEDNCATMFFIAEKQQKTIINFSLDSLHVCDKIIIIINYL